MRRHAIADRAPETARLGLGFAAVAALSLGWSSPGFAKPGAAGRASSASKPGVAKPKPVVPEFRIVNWNAAGTDCKWNGGKDEEVALYVTAKVAKLKANVVTLQEISGLSLYFLERALGATWKCYPQRFGDSLIATCVKGTGSNFGWQRLEGERYNEHTDWWGYVQVDYHGVKITNVHTRAHWAESHVQELHREVKTGIVAGDFNYQTPGWHQTASKLEPTWSNQKIDHIVTVEKPSRAWGDALEKGGSNHSVVVAVVKFGSQKLNKNDLPNTKPRKIPARKARARKAVRPARAK